MKRIVILLSMVLLLAAFPAAAKRKKNTDATPTPTPTPSATDAPSNSPLRKVKVDAVVLSSVEDKTVDGIPVRDIIILVNNLVNDGVVPISISYKNFLLKDPTAEHYYPAKGTNSDDFTKESTVSPQDNDIPYFKLYYRVPGDLRPEKIYLRVGDDIVGFKLQK